MDYLGGGGGGAKGMLAPSQIIGGGGGAATPPPPLCSYAMNRVIKPIITGCVFYIYIIQNFVWNSVIVQNTDTRTL